MKPIYRAVLFVVIWKGKKMGTFLYSLKWFTSKDKKQCQIHGFLVVFFSCTTNPSARFRERKKTKSSTTNEGGNEKRTSFPCPIMFIICKPLSLIKHQKRKAKQGRLKKKTPHVVTTPMLFQSYR